MNHSVCDWSLGQLAIVKDLDAAQLFVHQPTKLNWKLMRPGLLRQAFPDALFHLTGRIFFYQIGLMIQEIQAYIRLLIQLSQWLRLQPKGLLLVLAPNTISVKKPPIARNPNSSAMSKEPPVKAPIALRSKRLVREFKSTP